MKGGGDLSRAQSTCKPPDLIGSSHRATSSATNLARYSGLLRSGATPPYSGDLRARVIGDIVSGASRRAAAEYYGISPSVVMIWAQRFETTGSVAAKPSGGSHSPLD